MEKLLSAERNGIGILAMVVAVFLFSSCDIIAKWLGQNAYPPAEIVFFRYLFGIIPAGILVWISGLKSIATKNPGLHALRAFLIVSALGLLFWAIQLIPLAEVVAIAFVAPLFVTALSVPLLREYVGPRRWSAVLIGFLGALVILQPGSDAFQPESLLVIGSAMMFSLAMILTRKMAQTETTTSMFAYTTIGACLLSIPFLGLEWRTPDIDHIWLLVFLGLIGGTAALLIIVSYRNAPAALVAPFEYTGLIWGSIAGWLFWNEQPGVMVWTGAAIIIVSSLYITKRETTQDHDE